MGDSDVEGDGDAMSEHEGEQHVRAMLKAIGEDPDREGIRDTPRRVIKALLEMTSGTLLDPKDVLGTTFDGGGYDEVVCVTDIPYTSTCEHHLLPFTGHAHVAYLPRMRVVGLSKIPRVVDMFAQRLQLQEQLTKQIANALGVHLNPRGVAVVLEGAHSCMSCRGVKKSGATMVTSVMEGVFRTDASVRAEVLHLISMSKGRRS